MTRRRHDDLDPTSWPAFDDRALPASHRSALKARRQAIELYLHRTPLTEIESLTGIDRRQLYRLIDRCMVQHDDGRLLGWRALAPWARVGVYRRTLPLALSCAGDGAAGAFGLLLQSRPALATWITQRVRAKSVTLEQISTDVGLRTRLGGLKPLHIDFLRQCRLQGLTAVDYPFSAGLMGIRSLSAAVRAECLRNFGRGARLAGATHLKGMPGDSDTAPAATQALDVVEFDGHRLDLRLKVVVRDPLGFEQEFEIERIWVLVIIDVWSRAVLVLSTASLASTRSDVLNARGR